MRCKEGQRNVRQLSLPCAVCVWGVSVCVSLPLTEAVKVFLGPDMSADEHAHVLAVEIVIKVVDDVHLLQRDG